MKLVGKLLFVSPEQINDEIKLSIEYIGYNVKLLTVQGSYSKDLNIFLVPVEYALLGDVVIVGGIYVKPTIWQRIKNMITFWK
jgi:actin-related protein